MWCPDQEGTGVGGEPHLVCIQLELAVSVGGSKEDYVGPRNLYCPWAIGFHVSNFRANLQRGDSTLHMDSKKARTWHTRNILMVHCFCPWPGVLDSALIQLVHKIQGNTIYISYIIRHISL